MLHVSTPSLRLHYMYFVSTDAAYYSNWERLVDTLYRGVSISIIIFITSYLEGIVL